MEKMMSEIKKKKKIICIGAGASGLFFALNCADENNEVILIDSNSKVGRKMYISGKGRCNITNDCDVKEFIQNVIRNPKFLYSAINRFKPSDTIEFFNSHGCALKTERGKRVFPVSDKAADIIDCLFFEGKRRGVKYLFEKKIDEVYRKDDKFYVKGNAFEYEADKLVIATGGLSYPSTGSTGDGYLFAQNFGHQIVETKSALCPLKIKEKINPEMMKLTLKNVELKAESGNFKKSIFGDLEFLNNAITGPIALSMSSLINRLEEVKLSLDLKPALDENKLDERLLRDIAKNPNKDVRYLLKALLPGEFIDFFIINSGIDPDMILNSLSRDNRLKIVHELKNFKLTYLDLEDISKGIVTSGGVDVSQIDPKTMESKLIKDLYFIGEVLDVDALTGGFNLQIALSTGYACAMAIRVE